jgi:hypothetical protein
MQHCPKLWWRGVKIIATLLEGPVIEAIVLHLGPTRSPAKGPGTRKRRLALEVNSVTASAMALSKHRFKVRNSSTAKGVPRPTPSR